ncbi:Sucrose phosphorylase [compost metagenome]
MYYVGLMAGRNDIEQVEKTGDGREINRHNYTVEEIERGLEQDVVKRLMKLIRFRNTYSAFDGAFQVLDAPPDEIRLLWEQEGKYCRLFISLLTYQTVIEYADEEGRPATYQV